MRTQVKLILATLPLTALIWIYADQTGQQKQMIRISVRIDTPPDVVPNVEGHLPDASDTRSVQIEVRGPKAALRNLGAPKGVRGTYFEVAIPAKDDPDPGSTYMVDIWAPIAEELRQRELGLHLRSVVPPSISYTVDRYEEVEVDVVLDAGSLTNELEGSVMVRPKSVKARVLQSDLRALYSGANQPLRVLIEDDLRSRLSDSNPVFHFDVHLGSKWQRINAEFKPDTVQVNGQFKRGYKEEEISLIPLRVLLPGDWPYDQYDIQWVEEADRIQKITVRIPGEVPRVPTAADVIAYVRVDLPHDTSLENGTLQPPGPESSVTPLDVHFVFPDQEFKDVRISSPPRTVKVRITKQTNPAQTPG